MKREPTELENKLLELDPEASIDATYLGQITREGWDCYHWTITVTFQGRTHSTDYFCGLAHATKRADRIKPIPPSIGDVVSSLILDAQAGLQAFADFCDDFGYNVDSRKALCTWEHCLDSARSVQRLLGKHLETLQSCEH